MINTLFILISTLFVSQIPSNDTEYKKINNTQYEVAIGDVITEKTASGLSKKEKKSRNAAVKILSGGGHGSGALLKFQNESIVITAQHVVASEEIGRRYLIVSPQGEIIYGKLVYADKLSDIAFLLMESNFKTVKPVIYDPNYKMKKLPAVGVKTIYSGFPSALSLLSIRGSVAGYEFADDGRRAIIVHTFGWFGCSGSAVFDEKGNILGVLFGVSVSRYQVLDNIIWVSPIGNVDNYILMKNMCTLTDAKFCPDKN